MPIPFELITMLGSGLMSGVMTLWSQSQKAKQAAFERAISGLAAKAKATDEARRYENNGFQITRRIIALAVVFAFIVWPKILPVLFPDMPVIVGYTTWNPGFMFFSSGSEVIKWEALQGLVMTPLDTHIMSSIIGLYFGSSIVKNAR